MFETEKVEKRIKDLVQKIGTDFLADEGVFRAVINDVLYDLKLERTALINATSVHIGKIFLAAKDLPYEEKRKAKNKAKDKLINEAAFSEEGADFVVTVLSTALGWPKAGVAKIRPVPPPPESAVSAKSQSTSTSADVPVAGESPTVSPGKSSFAETPQRQVHPAQQVPPAQPQTGTKKKDAAFLLGLAGVMICVLVFVLSDFGRATKVSPAYESDTNIQAADTQTQEPEQERYQIEIAGELIWSDVEILDLSEKNISDISPLASLTNLTDLILWGNNISDISSLASLTNLTILGLGGNEISDISPLASLTNLTFLGLHQNNISDISPLASLTNLTELNLEQNRISDISSLKKLKNLQYLQLGGNPLMQVQIDELQAALPNCDIGFDTTE
ncbi:hypothetical protein AGMMS49983_01370 [Clostridia bacterium]|nr:hypothetical protein AGMMS49983_01370 [Clostridia bacterium]